MPYTLQADGDGIEQMLFGPLIQPRFPSYEVFWQKFVVPLTNRPANVQLKTDPDLVAIGKGDHDLCLAQLHYSVLRHLGRAFQLRQDHNFGLDHLVFSLSAIVGAQDVAFELLERFRNPISYGAWLGKKSGGIDGGREAQSKWKQSDGYPLQAIRDYRNHLVHGRTPPGLFRLAQGHGSNITSSCGLRFSDEYPRQRIRSNRYVFREQVGIRTPPEYIRRRTSRVMTTPTSRPVSILFCSDNPHPVIDMRSCW
jgi:hypothetical protein